VLTTQEWESSADIFPIEYADILERHRVLHGALPLDRVGVSRADLRLELEHEAMGGVLQMRRGIMAAGGDGRRQLELLESSLSPMMVVFRATLRLDGVKPPADNAELSREVGARAGLDAEPFIRVVRHVRGDLPMRPADSSAVLAGFIRGAERLVGYLDSHTAAG
jgi:hypothetical protein